MPEDKGRKRKDGRFTVKDFKYDAGRDCYVCPAGQALTFRRKVDRGGQGRRHYRSERAHCDGCAVRRGCLARNCRTRSVYRWVHEDVMDRHKERMAGCGGMMRRRGALVEHPFGTMKRWCGMDHFLMRGLEKCQAELSLMVTGYNFKRALNIVGVQAMRDCCAEKQRNALNQT